MDNLLLAAVFTHQSDGLRADNILCRGKMVCDQDDPVGIGRTRGAHALHLLDGDRAANVVNEHNIGADYGDLPGAGRSGHRVRRVYLFCHGLAHRVSFAARFTNPGFCIIKAGSRLGRCPRGIPAMKFNHNRPGWRRLRKSVAGKGVRMQGKHF